MSKKDPIIDREEILEEAEEKREHLRQRELADLRKLVASPEGKRFFLRSFDHTGLFRSSYTGNANTYFREGRRDVALWLFHEILEAVPDPSAIGAFVRLAGSEKAREEDKDVVS